MVPGVRLVRETFDDVVDAVCADLFLQAGGCVQTFGDVHIAIEPSPRALGAVLRLMVDPLYRSLPWDRAHVWLTSDGPHPPSDERSGFAELAGYIGEHAGIPAGQLHAIPIGEGKPDEVYESELRRCLSHREPGHARLDFVLAELDASANVGGLVAGDADDRALTARGDGRVSLNLTALNGARCVAVLAAGAEASGPLADIVAGEGIGALITPIAGELRWYLDHPACTGANAGENPPA